MQPIDAVITWVDGADAAHRRKFLEHVPAEQRARHAAAHATRFGDCGEIAWCVASLLRFAPWIGTIYIVADDQQPDFVARIRGTPLEKRVRVVDHREIFAGHEQFLPTFSNRSIEAMLHRIPGLAEHFIYFNDDFMLLRDVAPGDFFDADADGVVLRGRWRVGALRERAHAARNALERVLRLGRVTDHIGRPGNHAAQLRSARLAGFHERYFQFPHCPHPLRRSTIAAWYDAHPDLLARNISAQLRTDAQFLTVALANHLEIAAGKARIDNRLAPLRLQPDARSLPDIRRQVARADRDAAIAFACVQSLDLAPSEVRAFVNGWLSERIGQAL